MGSAHTNPAWWEPRAAAWYALDGQGRTSGHLLTAGKRQMRLENPHFFLPFFSPEEFVMEETTTVQPTQLYVM